MKPVDPRIVALARGAIIAAVVAAAGAVTLYASDNADNLHRYWWGPLVLLAARSIEGAVDKRRGQADQAGVGGSKPANPADYV